MLLLPDERLRIQQQAYPSDERYNKHHFHKAIQELFIANGVVELSETTRKTTTDLLDALRLKLSEETEDITPANP